MVRRHVSAAATALLDHMVGEACAYVQGESLKAHAALLTEAFQLPDHQVGGEKFGMSGQEGDTQSCRETHVASDLEGVAGWLHLLCLMLTILSPILITLRLLSEWSFVATHPEFVPVFTGESAISVSTTAFGIYAGVRLWGRENGAVAITRLFLITLIAVSLAQPFIIAAIAIATTSISGDAVEIAFRQGLQSAVPSVVSAAIWLAYLHRSRRVRATYRTPVVASRAVAQRLRDKAKSWLPVERVCFVIGCASVLLMLLSAVTLEFTEHSKWFDIRREEILLDRPLPSQEELGRVAKTLPPNAVRFAYQHHGGFWNELSTSYVGYFDPQCQKKRDDATSDAITKETACQKLNDSLREWSRRTGQEPVQEPCGLTFGRPSDEPDDECVLVKYSDRYMGSTLKSYWNLAALFGNFAFLTPLVMSFSSFALFLLFRPIWLPLRRWIKEG